MRERSTDALVRLYRRGPSWWAGYREDGRHVRQSLGVPYLADARLLAGKIEERLRRKSVGLVDPCAEHAARPIAEHVADFKAVMDARGGTNRHTERTLKYLRDGVAATGAKRVGDLDVAAASRWLEEARATGLSARTINVRVQSLRAFGRWLVETRRTTHDPFVGLQRRNVAADRRRVRRALTVDETARLLDAARTRPLAEAEAKGYDLTADGRAALVARGARRALVYLVALGTGVRRGELGRIRWRDLDLVGAVLTIPAGSAKARREQAVDLGENVLDALTAEREARAKEDPDDLVLPPKGIPGARTFARDLQAAGIEPRGEDGTVLDFHALRTTLGTRLSDANVPLVQAQRILRHSTPVLTANVYSRPASTDLREALNRASAYTPRTRSTERTADARSDANTEEALGLLITGS